MNLVVFPVLWWIIMTTGSFYTMIKVMGGDNSGFLECVPFGFLNSILSIRLLLVDLLVIRRSTLGVLLYVSERTRLRSSFGNRVDWRTGVDCQ